MPAVSRVVAMAVLCLPSRASAQQAGHLEEESHPPLATRECSDNGCELKSTQVVLDANWRWIEKDVQNCYKGTEWVPDRCTDPKQCALDCALEGADYGNKYGISTPDDETLELRFITGRNVGSRVYLMEDEDSYKMFKLKNREFAMDVDVSNLPCGVNGAVYFVEMDPRGDYDGKSNRAGAKYGTGYCDAQCPHDLKFVKGEANLLDWKEETGRYGACCAEMDIWEANSQATAFTPHPCRKPGLTKCDGKECGDNSKGERYEGICDKDGCDFNSFRLGNTSFFGKGSDFTIDTSKKFTVVTQFLTTDRTDEGDLSEIRRFYVQDGVVVPNSAANLQGPASFPWPYRRQPTPSPDAPTPSPQPPTPPPHQDSLLPVSNSITADFCSAQKAAFGDIDDFTEKGGLKAMGEAMERGMVLVMSLWDDTAVNMLWLDSAYPEDARKTQPGVQRGPCPGGKENKPEYLRRTFKDAFVRYSNIRSGSIGSTSGAPGVETSGPRRQRRGQRQQHLGPKVV